MGGVGGEGFGIVGVERMAVGEGDSAVGAGGHDVVGEGAVVGGAQLKDGGCGGRGGEEVDPGGGGFGVEGDGAFERGVEV